MLSSCKQPVLDASGLLLKFLPFQDGAAAAAPYAVAAQSALLLVPHAQVEPLKEGARPAPLSRRRTTALGSAASGSFDWIADADGEHC